MRPLVRPVGPLLVASTLAAAPAVAQPEGPPQVRASRIGWQERFGVGVSLGQPTGATVKYYLDARARHAMDATLGLHSITLEGPGPFVQVGYAYHPSNLASGPAMELRWRVGAGVFAGATGEVDPTPALPGYPHPYDHVGFFGARGVVGLDLDLVETPVQVFLDVAPSLALLPDPHLSLGGAIGARWYF